MNFGLKSAIACARSTRKPFARFLDLLRGKSEISSGTRSFDLVGLEAGRDGPALTFAL
jgi:hypothetical protein